MLRDILGNVGFDFNDRSDILHFHLRRGCFYGENNRKRNIPAYGERDVLLLKVSESRSADRNLIAAVRNQRGSIKNSAARRSQLPMDAELLIVDSHCGIGDHGARRIGNASRNFTNACRSLSVCGGVKRKQAHSERQTKIPFHRMQH